MWDLTLFSCTYAALHERAQRESPNRDHRIGRMERSVVASELWDEQDGVDHDVAAVGDGEFGKRDHLGVVCKA